MTFNPLDAFGNELAYFDTHPDEDPFRPKKVEKKPDINAPRCGMCQGNGWLDQLPDDALSATTCHYCNGTGVAL